jgi:ATP-dependent DNA helicase MPH1
LRDLLIGYFGQRMPDEAADDEDVGASNAMVFANSREVVDEIAEMLEAHRPLVRASRFIGQGLDKQGKKGMAQRMQLEVRMCGSVQ